MLERVRESVSGLPAPDYFDGKAKEGWKLVALEWQRDAPERAAPVNRLLDVPFGFRVAPDCRHLEVQEEEFRALMVMMEVIVQDRPLSDAAAELNQRGFRTRAGARWTAVDVFNLLPRLIETGPAIFNREEWVALRQRL